MSTAGCLALSRLRLFLHFFSSRRELKRNRFRESTRLTFRLTWACLASSNCSTSSSEMSSIMLLLMASVLGVEALENPQSGKISPSPELLTELVLELDSEMELQEFLSEDPTSSWLFQEMEGEGWVRIVLVLLVLLDRLSLASSFWTAAQWMLQTRLDLSLCSL